MILVVVVLCMGVVMFAAIAFLLIISNQESEESGPGGGEDDNANPGTGEMFGVDTRALQATGGIAPIKTIGGKEVFQVTFEAGKRGPGGSDTNMKFSPSGYFPSDSCRISFRIKFDDSWVWTESPGHNVSGKLGGFKIGSGDSSGSKYSTTGASYRLTFKQDKAAVAYLYPQVKQNFSGSISWNQLDLSPELQKQSYIAAGVHVFHPNRQTDALFKSGEWNAVEMYLKLNTPGRHDGIMEMVVNGVRQRLDKVRYRYDDAKIENFDIGAFFGGGDNSYAPPKTTRAWYTDFRFSKA